MLRCWHEVSTKRPPFEQLNDELQVRATVLAAEAKKADSGHAGNLWQRGSVWLGFRIAFPVAKSSSD